MPFKDSKKRKLYARAWYLKNRERIREKNLIHYAQKRKDDRYPESKRKYAKEYYLKNRERILERGNKWRKQNPEKAASYVRKSYARNPVIAKVNHQEWCRSHPEKIRLYHFRRRIGGREKLDADTLDNIFRDNINQHGRLTCIYCCLPIGDKNKLTIDHLVPISRGGNNGYENLGLSCFSCNAKKHTKTHDEFIKYSKPLAFIKTEFVETRKQI